MAGENVSKERLGNIGSVHALGVIAARELQEHGMVTLFVNKEGVVELCPVGEIELDTEDQQDALVMLVNKGYEDAGLEAYLKGREAREALRDAKNM